MFTSHYRGTSICLFEILLASSWKLYIILVFYRQWQPRLLGSVKEEKEIANETEIDFGRIG